MSSHQAIEFLEELVDNAERHLRVASLINLPVLPAGQTLQTLIDSFNSYDVNQHLIDLLLKTQNNLKDRENQIKDLEVEIKKLSSKEAQLAAKQQEIDKLNNQITSLENNVNQLKEETNNLREKLDQDLDLENEILKIELEAKEQEVINQQKNIDQLKEAREKLYQQVQELQDALDKKINAADLLRTKLAEKEQEIKDLQEKLKQAQGSGNNKSLLERLRTLLVENNKLKKDLTELENRQNVKAEDAQQRLTDHLSRSPEASSYSSQEELARTQQEHIRRLENLLTQTHVQVPPKG
jgi:chromosome segregation ATPase